MLKTNWAHEIDCDLNPCPFCLNIPVAFKGYYREGMYYGPAISCGCGLLYRPTKKKFTRDEEIVSHWNFIVPDTSPGSW